MSTEYMERLADECHFEELHDSLEAISDYLGWSIVDEVSRHVFAAVGAHEGSAAFIDTRYSIVVTHRVHPTLARNPIIDIDVEFDMGEGGAQGESWSVAWANVKDVRIVGYEANLVIDRCLARPVGCSFRVEEIAAEAGIKPWKAASHIKAFDGKGLRRVNYGSDCVDALLAFAVTDPAKLSAMRVLPPVKPFAIRKSVLDRLYHSDWEERSYLLAYRYLESGCDVAVFGEDNGTHRVALESRPGLTEWYVRARKQAIHGAASKLSLDVRKGGPWNDLYVDVPWRKLPKFMRVYKATYESFRQR